MPAVAPAETPGSSGAGGASSCDGAGPAAETAAEDFVGAFAAVVSRGAREEVGCVACLPVEACALRAPSAWWPAWGPPVRCAVTGPERAAMGAECDVAGFTGAASGRLTRMFGRWWVTKSTKKMAKKGFGFRRTQ